MICKDVLHFHIHFGVGWFYNTTFDLILNTTLCTSEHL
jgi:hypothetical protein